ncbi:trafficking protein particle complex subunit 3 [Skeletonema marinoi]|jgi:hypothetical protein|uniref:Trafficking protein particle complex subunit n=2 Tax=Skeletonema marinoi TaxID=267567 RepID=A0AAD8YI64_9STRA|nr:trafficking protein particle complex subunit 3 [Skeletonema marinoi]|mmetsp:Transcript_27368/g.42135  ORF Transcript_27368/g.42135 Transcript_27368/m.42135 type:complete len:200 (+) Transcript_27368:58-657(+)
MTSKAQAGTALWAKMPKANAELFALTYGSLVTELVRDYEDPIEVNAQLDRIGHSIGVRCVDEFLSKADVAGMGLSTQCNNLRDTAEVVAKVGFKMFLGVTAEVGGFSQDQRSFSVYLQDNPLSTFVELPSESAQGGDDLRRLKYSQILCGVIRGALEQVNLKVECSIVRDTLKGDEVNEIRVDLKEVLADGAGDDYKEE